MRPILQWELCASRGSADGAPRGGAASAVLPLEGERRKTVCKCDAMDGCGMAVQEMRLVDADPHSATCKFTIASKPPNPLWEFTRTPAVDVTVCSMLPCSTYIFFELAGGVSFYTYVSAAPVSATKTVARFCLLRNFAPWGGALADHIARNAVYQVCSECSERDASTLVCSWASVPSRRYLEQPTRRLAVRQEEVEGLLGVSLVSMERQCTS
jgi:hypothetical protein